MWDGNRLLAESRGSHTRSYLYEAGSFVPLAQIDSGPAPAEANQAKAEVRYFHTDHLGTPRESTDGGGNVQWAASYKAWGNVLRVEMEQVQVAAEAESQIQTQALRFQGQYYDVETGLHYNRFRYYDPDIGRFVSQDPIGLTGGNNLYQYEANPGGWVDPPGLSCSSCKGKLASPASQMIPLERGSCEWENAVKEMQGAVANGEKFQVKVKSSTDAKAFLQEAQGNMNRYKAHTQSGRADGASKYTKGHEQHMAPEG